MDKLEAFNRIFRITRGFRPILVEEGGVPRKQPRGNREIVVRNQQGIALGAILICFGQGFAVPQELVGIPVRTWKG